MLEMADGLNDRARMEDGSWNARIEELWAQGAPEWERVVRRLEQRVQGEESGRDDLVVGMTLWDEEEEDGRGGVQHVLIPNR